MVALDPNVVLEAGAAIITAVGGLYGGARHILRRSKTKKEEYRRDILNAAKEEADKVKRELETKIKALEVELVTQKSSIDRDIEHMRESYMAEMRTVGEKINDMKEQLNLQHSQLVSLLTRLVDR